MRKLSEFKQSAESPIQHQLFGGQEAHKRFDLLENVFANAGHELAKPVQDRDERGIPVIRFLTTSSNMSEALTEVNGTEVEAAFREAFEAIHEEAKKRGISRDWIESIRNHCQVHFNGSSFAFAWGMEFYPPTRVPPPPPLAGCTDPEAINFDPLAQIDDGSCRYRIRGCTDDKAVNYDPSATEDDGSCIYPVHGCTDPSAINYNEEATHNDGSCIYADGLKGCTDPRATNYDPKATEDDGTCIYPVYGCTDKEALNYNSNATIDDGTCRYDSSTPWWMWVMIALVLLLLALLLLGVDGCNGAYASRGHLPSPLTGRFEPNPLPGFTPDQSNNMLPIPEESIVIDPVTGNEIAQGRVNIYPKNQDVDFPTYLRELQTSVGELEVVVTDYCHETRRVQLDIGELDYMDFKSHLQSELQQFDLLVWPEVIYSVGALSDAPEQSAALGNWHVAAVNATEVLANHRGRKEITVAIVDSGFATNHEGLDQDTTAQYHIVTREHTVFANQEITHGTHVAGLAIGEPSESVGHVGIGHGCSWMPVQLSEFSESAGLSSTHIVDGVLYAINHGADIVNLSLGGINPELILALWREGGADAIEELVAYQSDEAQFWNELYKIGEENNCLFVVAAGNESLPMELDPMQRSEFPIYVAATTASNTLADFSNFPTGNEFTDTPGVCIAAPGDSLFSFAVDGSYTYMAGTSMAAPVVAGSIGFVRSVHPHLSNGEIRELLLTMPSHVNSWQKESWVLVTDAPINLMAGQWTFDVEHEKREQIVLGFSENGKFSCSTCNESYRRGNWWTDDGKISVKFYDSQNRTSVDMTGTWNEGAFVGTGYKDGSIPLTFKLTPNSTDESVHPATSIPLLDVGYLVNHAPQAPEL